MRLGLVCIFALLAACAALHAKPQGFREGAPWDEARWTDEPEPLDGNGP
jgi:hypothetical protein